MAAALTVSPAGGAPSRGVGALAGPTPDSGRPSSSLVARASPVVVVAASGPEVGTDHRARAPLAGACGRRQPHCRQRVRRAQTGGLSLAFKSRGWPRGKVLVRPAWVREDQVGTCRARRCVMPWPEGPAVGQGSAFLCVACGSCMWLVRPKAGGVSLPPHPEPPRLRAGCDRPEHVVKLLQTCVPAYGCTTY